MVVTLGQQYNVGEKPTVKLYTYINRHAGTLLSNYVIRCSIRGTSLYHTLRRSTKSTAVSTAVVGETDITIFTYNLYPSLSNRSYSSERERHTKPTIALHLHVVSYSSLPITPLPKATIARFAFPSEMCLLSLTAALCSAGCLLSRWARRPLVPPLLIFNVLLARTYFIRWPHVVTRSGASPDFGHFFTIHLTFIPPSFTSNGLSSRTYFHTPGVFLIARPHASPTAGWMGSPAGNVGVVLLLRARKQSRRPHRPQLPCAFSALGIQCVCAA